MLDLYPAGAVYISASSTSPASLFGGTWERIKDMFLLAAGDTYAAGSTGGEEAHALTASENASHNHEQPVIFESDIYPTFTTNKSGITIKALQGGQYYDAGSTINATGAAMMTKSGNSGGSEPHNNMPPYLAVYMWKRVS